MTTRVIRGIGLTMVSLFGLIAFGETSDIGTRLSGLLIQKGEILATYQMTSGIGFETLTVLKKPVDAQVFKKEYGTPAKIEKDVSPFSHDKSAPITPPKKGEIWQYGRIDLFVREGKVLQFALWKDARESRIISHLARLGEGVKTSELIEGTKGSPNRVRMLNKAFDVNDIVRAFAKPDRIDKDKWEFYPTRQGPFGIMADQGDLWVYGQITLFVKDKMVRQFAEWDDSTPAMASAKQSLAQGNWDSLVRFAGDLTKDPQHAVVASDLVSYARYMQGHYNESLKNPVSLGSSGPRLSPVYKQWASEYPDNVHVLVALAAAYVQESNIADAVEALEKARSIDGSNPHVLTALGVAKRNMGQTDEAVALQLKAIELDSKLGPAYAALGAAYLFKERPADAQRILQKGVEMCPDYAPTWSNLGLAYRRQQSFDRAIECYQKAMALFPGDPVDYLNLGAAYAYKGRYVEARQAWQKAVELDPNGSTGASAKRNLSRLP